MALPGIVKKAVKPIYHFVHDTLFDTIDYNPLFPNKQGGKKIPRGHISAEHLANPQLDDQLSDNLVSAGIRVKDFYIEKVGYEAYMAAAKYPESYYGGGFDSSQNFVEKTLEHYVSTKFIDFMPETVFVDIAACTSPFSENIRSIYGVKTTYRQDLVFPKGVDNDRIGGYAHEIPLEDNSVDGITLHCSLEHFEGDSDTLFFQTAERILKPGGRVVVLPFYIADEYTIHLDPVFNLIKGHKPKVDPVAKLRYCNWYQYFSRHYDVNALQKRILEAAPGLDLTIYRVRNFKKVHPGSYLRFIGVFEKKRA
ncbi:MAG: methyltransferase domain-containing protein [Bacteroidota bacterium]